MTSGDQGILEKVRTTVGADRLNGAIVYLDRGLISPGESRQLGDVVIKVPWPAHIAFVDLEPKANWGHESRYLAIREDGDDVIETPAQMPPFLKPETSTFKLLWRGPEAPEWAVATD